jgi:hypothetical protein
MITSRQMRMTAFTDLLTQMTELDQLRQQVKEAQAARESRRNLETRRPSRLAGAEAVDRPATHQS